MKITKSLIIILLAMAMLTCFFACGDETCTHDDSDKDGKCDKCGETVTVEECTHEDGDSDGKCDKCGEELNTPSADGLTLIENGELKFQFVQGSDVKVETVKILDKFKETLSSEFKVNVEIVRDSKETEKDVEILIGTVESRGDACKYDKYSLGKKGYAITRIGSKILITAGSDEMLNETLAKFIENILGIKEGTTKLESVSFTKKDDTVNVQDDYRIESVLINGKDIRDYKIVVDAEAYLPAVATYKTAALRIQDYLYTSTGYYLEVTTHPEDAGENAIYIRHVPKGKAGSKGFRAVLSGDSLVIECAHYNKFEEAFNTYYNKTFAYARDKVLNLKKYDSDVDITKVYYSDFGAVGDGKTNDYAAILNAHIFANAGGQTVYGSPSATYLLKNIVESIPIRTDVNWNGAKIIIDDSNVTAPKNTSTGGIEVSYSTNAFIIENDYKDIRTTENQLAAVNSVKDDEGFVIRGLESGNPTVKLNLSLGYPAMVTVYNENHYNYIRYGFVGNIGSAQHELVLIDEYGNVDPSTPFLHDYKELTSITIHRIDVPEISVGNATVESIASRINLHGGYYTITRGISIKRPNVTLEDITHIISGEIPNNEPVRVDSDGLSYSVRGEGFSSNGTTIMKDGKVYTGGDVTAFTGHSYNGFVEASNTTNILVENVVFQARVYYKEGTYDISGHLANNLVFKNCTQSNFFEPGTTVPNLGKCWGVAGTNFCKNMEYIDSKLTRYDAHAGVTNGKIINSEIAVLRLIGGGDFIMENTLIWPRWGATPIQLREDYGASFNGTLTVKDCTIKSKVDNIISAANSYWDMGYQCFFPNLVIDNLKMDGVKTGDTVNLVATGYRTEFSNAYRYPNRDIILKDASDPAISGYKFHYDTKDPDGYVAQHITAEDGKFHGLKYELVSHGSYSTVIITDTINRFTYEAPDFIEVKNNTGNIYQLTLFDADFFKDTEIIAEGKNLQMVRVPIS